MNTILCNTGMRDTSVFRRESYDRAQYLLPLSDTLQQVRTEFGAGTQYRPSFYISDRIVNPASELVSFFDVGNTRGIQPFTSFLVDFDVETIQSAEIYSRASEGSTAFSEFAVSRELAELYVTALAWETDDIAPIHVESTSNESLMGEPLAIVQQYITERLTSLFAAIAYRAAAENHKYVLLSDKNLHFSSSIAVRLIDVLILDPYSAPRFLDALAKELDLVLGSGELRAPWGILRHAPAGLHLEVLATFERNTSTGTRARILGGPNIS
jgi:hypothetical protein